MNIFSLRLILSAFAVSLFFCGPLFAQFDEEDLLELDQSLESKTDEFMGLEDEVLPELIGPQKFLPLQPHAKSDWNVLNQEINGEYLPLKGQSRSLIDWDKMDIDEWLSIDKWMLERSIKDKYPDWKSRLRSDKHLELAGKILHCEGSCLIYRGTGHAKVTHLSRVMEGDELRTEKDSSAWVYMMDGSLVRVGSESSLSIQEIIWTKTEVFHFARLNQGHVFWHSRTSSEQILDTAPETDSISLPLMVREANTQYFERSLFQKQTDALRLGEVLELEDTAIQLQYSKLNELIKSNNNHGPKKSKVLIVAPNVSISGEDISLDMIYLPGAKSFLKSRSDKEYQLHLRGYNQAEVAILKLTEWQEVEPSGRSYGPVAENLGDCQVMELLTKRVRSIELARELWFEKFTQPILAVSSDARKMAMNHGYTLWEEDDRKKRLDFLTEYTRRVETTNLKSIENLQKKLEKKGERLGPQSIQDLYSAALNHYLKFLKTRYISKRTQVKEMNDLQYYIWILRNGKF